MLDLINNCYTVILPGGVFIDGTIFKKVFLTKPNGHIEEFIGQCSDHINLAVIVTQVLTNCIKRIGNHERITTEIIEDMQVGDRDYLMLKLREYTIGEKVDIVIQCPNECCRKIMDISFSLTDIPVNISSCKSLYHKYKCRTEPNSDKDRREITIEFRLPTGEDQELLSQKFWKEEKEALQSLLKRCIKTINGVKNIDKKAFNNIPDIVFQKLDRKIRQLSPGIDPHMEADCPECHNKFTFPFNVSQLLIDEMKQNLTHLYRQVHQLAFHYNWTEQDILAMDRNKRIKYNELIHEMQESTIQLS